MTAFDRAWELNCPNTKIQKNGEYLQWRRSARLGIL